MRTLERSVSRACLGLMLCGMALSAGATPTLGETALAQSASTLEPHLEAGESTELAPQTVYGEQPPSPPVSKTESTMDSVGDRDAYPIGYGDRLRIRIYDRPDLTAEYRVNDQGEIRIPTLGTLEVANRSVEQLETAIADRIERLLQRPGTVIADVIERQPIYVTGLVVKPGAYRFSANMAVIHATALAGGTSQNAFAALLPTEALREGSRARSSEEDLKHLLATEARLKAERNASSEIITPPELIQLAGAQQAADLIGDERENMTQRREILDRQMTLLNSSIKEAQTEVEAFQKELSKIQEQRTIRATALEALESLAKKGLTTQQRMTDSQFLLASADRDAQTAIANISRSQQNLDKAKRDLAVLTLERKMSIAKELQNIGDRIARARLSIDGSRKVIGQITGLPAELLKQNQEPQFRYEIIRKGNNGELHTTVVTEMTKLQPGDVVRVRSPEQGNPDAVSSSPDTVSSN